MNNNPNEMPKKEIVVNIKHEFKFGDVGINDNPDSALFRPLRVLTEEGRPIGYYQYVVFHNKQKIHNCNSNYLILGSFVYSDRKMILFFPGILGRHFTFYNYDGRIVQSKDNLNKIDHFSLEPSLDRWHVTYYDNDINKRYKKSLSTDRIDNTFIHWFSMSIQDINKLEVFKANNELSFHCKEDDAKRRVDEHNKAIKNARHNIVEVVDARTVIDPSFIHFDFFIRETGGENVPPPRVCFAEQSLLGDRGLLPNGSFPVRSHVVQLD